MKVYLMIFTLLYSSALFAENEIQKVAVDNKFCTSPVQTMDEIYENGALTYCVYDGLTIIEAYKKYVSEHNEDFLEKTLNVNVNAKKEYTNDGVLVEYKWENPHKLTIEQQFAGGITILILEENKKGTNMTITGYPD